MKMSLLTKTNMKSSLPGKDYKVNYMQNLHPGPLSKKGSLSCHTQCDFGPRDVYHATHSVIWDLGLGIFIMPHIM